MSRPTVLPHFLPRGESKKNISKGQREASFSFSLGDFCSFGAIVCLCKTKEQQKEVTRVRESKVFFSSHCAIAISRSLVACQQDLVAIRTSAREFTRSLYQATPV